MAIRALELLDKGFDTAPRTRTTVTQGITTVNGSMSTARSSVVVAGIFEPRLLLDAAQNALRRAPEELTFTGESDQTSFRTITRIIAEGTTVEVAFMGAKGLVVQNSHLGNWTVVASHQEALADPLLSGYEQAFVHRNTIVSINTQFNAIDVQGIEWSIVQSAAAAVVDLVKATRKED